MDKLPHELARYGGHQENSCSLQGSDTGSGDQSVLRQHQVAYLRHKGGTRSGHLTQGTIEILLWSDINRVMLLSIHLPGARNVTANALSQS